MDNRTNIILPTSKKTVFFRLILPALLIIGSLFYLRLAITNAQADDTVACDEEAYLTQNNSNNDADASTSEMYKTKASNPSAVFRNQPIDPDLGRIFNAMGLRAKDGRFYAVVPTNGNIGRISKIAGVENNLKVELIGAPNALVDGLTDPGISGYFAGDIRNEFLPGVANAADGRLYTYALDNSNPDNGSRHRLFRVRVATPDNYNTTFDTIFGVQNNIFSANAPQTAEYPSSLTNKQLQEDIGMNDWAFSPKNGMLYGYDSRHARILAVNPDTGAIADKTGFPLTNFPLGGTQQMDKDVPHGAVWFDAQGNFYTYRNGGGTFRVGFDSRGNVDPTTIKNFSLRATNTNDGAACPAVDFTKIANPDTIIEGESTTYIYKITNNHHSQRMKANFEDNLKLFGNDDREFVEVTKKENFYTVPNHTISADKKLLTMAIELKPDSTATIEVKVSTKRLNEDDKRELKNQAVLKNIVLPDLQKAGDRESDGDPDTPGANPTILTVNPVPGDRPYLRVYGNDVAAGSRMGEVCAVYNPEAKIRTRASKLAAGWAGAGSQLSAIATGQIQSFFSASQRVASPNPAIGLTFGNYVTGTDFISESSESNLGGFSGFSRCLPNYFALGDTVAPGDKNIGGRTLGPTDKQVVFVDGDAYIENPIQYNLAGWSTGEMPSFYLIVRGNIYIAPGVDRLDGVYIAQPKEDGTKGEIRTCATSSGIMPSTTNRAICETKLKINGGFIARQVRFWRTRGRLQDAQPRETADNPTNIAEVFDFSPEIYLSPLDPSLRRNVPYQKYDYIASLPPIL